MFSDPLKYTSLRKACQKIVVYKTWVQIINLIKSNDWDANFPTSSTHRNENIRKNQNKYIS